nr:glycosyltransferase family 2 protein [Bifidobacterium animalis]
MQRPLESANWRNPPLVSVIIPTRNRPDLVALAVHSVLSQSYTNLEVIVVDDNDSNSVPRADTKRELQRYSSDSRLSLISTTGSIGGGAARNFACCRACGDYLAFLDDDDEYLPDKIETQVRFMMHERLEMSYQDVSWYDPRNGELVECRHLDHARGFTKKDLLKAHIITPIAPTSVYMLKRSLFERTDGFGEVPVGQDWFLMLRCIQADAKIGYMPGVHVRQYLYQRERLSLGDNKIKGENELFAIRKSYFNLLSKTERRYVVFRHFAVLAVACARSHKMLAALKYVSCCMWSSPVDFAHQGYRYLTSAKKG